jgi:hypothetical protein
MRAFTRKNCCGLLVGLICFVACASGQTDVLTQHNDIARSGANLNEHDLTVAKLKQGQFGKLCYRLVDGNIYAQPLYASQVSIAGKGTHNIVLVATEHDSVYAFDADDTNQASTAALLWGPISLGTPVPSEVLSQDLTGTKGGCVDLTTEIGITSTPVISPDKKLVYVVAKSLDQTAGHHYSYSLNVLNLSDGSAACPPIDIQGQVPGKGTGSDGTNIHFDPKLQLNRAALLLVNNVLYIPFGGHCDKGNFHGWLFAYDVSSTNQIKLDDVFCTTPQETGDDAGEAGIWQSGQGPSCDASGNIYFATGNGSNNASTDFGDSVVKLSLVNSKFQVVDWYTPANQQILNVNDVDLGSSGPVLLPDSHLLVAAGKEGRAYLIDQNAMGKGAKPSLESFQVTNPPLPRNGTGPWYWNIHGSFVVWEHKTPTPNLFIYVCGEEDKVKQYQLIPSAAGQWKFQAHTPFAQSAESAPYPNYPTGQFKDPLRNSVWMPGGFLSISADQGKDGSGILWVSMPFTESANLHVVRGILRAYDASNISQEIWDSERNPADGVGMFAKFNPPMIANGKVYLATFQEELPINGTYFQVHEKNLNGDKPALAIYGLHP